MRNSEKIILLGQTRVSNQNFITLRVTVDKPHATHWLTLTTQGLGARTASFSVSYIYGGQTTLSTQKSQLIKPNLSNIVQRSEISNKAPFKFFIDYWSGAKLSRVEESAERTLELPSLFLSLFCICSLQNRVVFDEVFFVLRVTQRVALLDETKNGSGVALRDEGKNDSGRRISIRTVH